MESLMPTKQPRGQARTRTPTLANQPRHRRRRRIAHVHSRVQRCPLVKDRIRVWKEGVRVLVRELCCPLHHWQARLTPWQPMD